MKHVRWLTVASLGATVGLVAWSTLVQHSRLQHGVIAAAAPEGRTAEEALAALEQASADVRALLQSSSSSSTGDAASATAAPDDLAKLRLRSGALRISDELAHEASAQQLGLGAPHRASGG